MRARLGRPIRSALIGAGVVLLGLALPTACGGKKKPREAPSPEVTGLAAVPATAQVVIGVDVGKLAGSPITQRAVEQLLLRDPQLAASWTHVRDGCALDLPRQVKHVMLALGPSGQGAVGAGPVLMVATGTLAEPDLAGCLRTLVGKGGGALTAKTVVGRSIYQVRDGNRTMHFAFSRPDTVVLGTSEAWVTEALGTGPKAPSSAELTGWLALTDQNAPVWAVGRVDDRVRTGLIGASGGKLTAGPRAIAFALDPTTGAKADLGVVMDTPEDAKQLESFAQGELKVVGMVAQMKSLGAIVAKLTVAADGRVVRFRAALTLDEVNQLLSVLDEKPAATQVTPPTDGSGSDTSSK